LKITKGGPWPFRQNVVTIEEYGDFADPDTINMNCLAVWVQIHKLPDGYRSESLIKNLASKKLGTAVEVDSNSHGLGNFIRVKVRLDLRKLVGRFVTISREGQREFFKVQYEKMPRFYGACGLVGHTHLECGSGEHDENSLKWGDYLKAERETWHGRFAFGGNRGGARSSRGRNIFGRGSAENSGWGAGPGHRDRMQGTVIPQSGRGFVATAGIA
jgi:hypothetical protein